MIRIIIKMVPTDMAYSPLRMKHVRLIGTPGKRKIARMGTNVRRSTMTTPVGEAMARCRMARTSGNYRRVAAPVYDVTRTFTEHPPPI
jgi:hypothetical protein